MLNQKINFRVPASSQAGASRNARQTEKIIKPQKRTPPSGIYHKCRAVANDLSDALDFKVHPVIAEDLRTIRFFTSLPDVHTSDAFLKDTNSNLNISINLERCQFEITEHDLLVEQLCQELLRELSAELHGNLDRNTLAQDPAETSDKFESGTFTQGANE